MMGERRVQQGALFYEFSLERHVPARHRLRSIDRFVELDGLRRELAPFYSAIGRPSIDPELMIRMLIVGYCFGIRSERRLCEEVHLNLAYRWFCQLGLDGTVPDHSTFSKNRHGRFRESDLLRRLFESVLQRCIAEGLVGGEGFAVDASLIQADASDRTRVAGTTGLPFNAAGRAVEEYLAVLDDAAFGAATEDLVVEPRKPALALGDQLRVETGLPVARHRQLDLAGVGDDRLFAVAVTPVARLLAGEMMVHLGIENPFGQGLLQVIDQAVGIESRLGIGAGQQLVKHGVRNARFFASRHRRAPLLRSCPTSARNS